MDPATALQVAGVAAQLGSLTLKTGKQLYIFCKEVEHVDEDITAISQEVDALNGMCELVNSAILRIYDEITSAKEIHQSGVSGSENLAPFLKSQIENCIQTVQKLHRAIAGSEQRRSNIGQVWRCIKFNLQTRDIAETRNRIRSHTAGLHTALLTIDIEVSYLGPKLANAQLRNVLSELKEVRQELRQLRRERKPGREDHHDSLDVEMKVLDISDLVSQRAEDFYNESDAGDLIEAPKPRTGNDRVLRWMSSIHELDALVTDYPSSIGDSASDRHRRQQISRPMSPELEAHADAMHDALRDDESEEDSFDLEAARGAIDDGQAAFECAEYDRAHDILHEALSLIQELSRKRPICDPCDLRYMLAVCTFHLHDAEHAEKALLSVVEQVPKAHQEADEKFRSHICDANHLLAQVYVRMSRLDAALRRCEFAVVGRRKLLGRLHDRSLESVALHARIYEIQGNTTRAGIFRDRLPEGRRQGLSKLFAELGVSQTNTPGNSPDSTRMIAAEAALGRAHNSCNRDSLASTPSRRSNAVMTDDSAHQLWGSGSGSGPTRTSSEMGGRRHVQSRSWDPTNVPPTLTTDGLPFEETSCGTRRDSALPPLTSSPNLKLRRRWAECFKLCTKNPNDLEKALLQGDTTNALRLVTSRRGLAKYKSLGSSLKMAALFGEAEVVKSIIATGTKVSVEKKALSALHCAAYAGSMPVIELLLEQEHAVDSYCKDYGTPLCLAAIAERLDVVKHLLGYEANPSSDGSPLGSPVHAAFVTNNWSLVRVLIDASEESELYGTVNLAIVRKLRLAATAGSASHPAPESLIVNWKDDAESRIRAISGYPLAVSSYMGCTAVVERIIAHKTLKREVFKTCTASCRADDFVPQPQYNRSSHTPLTLAAMAGHEEIVTALIEHGASVRIPAQRSEHALWYATLNRHYACAELLIKRNARLDLRIKEFAKKPGMEDFHSLYSDSRKRYDEFSRGLESARWTSPESRASTGPLETALTNDDEVT